MSQLNGAYYGPSIPPPQHKRHYRGDGGGSNCCCCCGIFRCCCGCIFDCIFGLICKILTTLLILLIIVAVLLYFIVRPNLVKFHVSNAVLTQFNFSSDAAATNNNTLHYNLMLNFTIRNPNKRVGIYYDYIEARGFYHDVGFGNVTMQPFFQGTKNTTVVATTLKGENEVVLGSDKGSKVEEERGSGVYGIDLKVFMKVRFKFWFMKTGKVKPKAICVLKVPLMTRSKNGTFTAEHGGAFQDTACDWGYRWLWFHH
ncbi:NDR1/HIN1-like protein 3 [Arachis duranensis]|uniref:NDR1/HIN1-like protein 3 n=1 Tax=Arachis duranensis TaxID=130453 RepID=A0A6P4CGW9_ARADU|nr:NDR1/HIN1-like protein 3 [Arachis duranensis]XP_025634847.1 NDR1/HIN1-like protein 3 [Arachis hypogaea]XP_025635855.1 NDR1/HIN1-like protein 3 [Arachis hypogaea]QHO25906.1 Putative syntaxin [Arachis hypogaea]